MQSCSGVRVPRRHFAWCRWLLLLSITVLYLGTLRSDHDWGGDFAQYLAQAACFSQGSFVEFQGQTTFRYEHSTDRRIGPKYYPWGYPAILAPVYAWCGLNLVPLKVATAIFLPLSLFALNCLFRHQLSDSWRLCLLGLIGFNPAFVAAKEHLLSDLPFLFFAVLCLWSLQRVFPPCLPDFSAGFRTAGEQLQPAAAEPEKPELRQANLMTMQPLQPPGEQEPATEDAAAAARPTPESALAAVRTAASASCEPKERTSASLEPSERNRSPAMTHPAWLQAATHAGILGGLLFAACSIRANGIVLVLTTLLIPICRWPGSGGLVSLWVRHRTTRLRPTTQAVHTGTMEPSEWFKLSIVFSIFGLLTLVARLSLPHESSYFEQLTLITPRHILHNLLYYSFLMTLYFSPNVELIGGVFYLLTVPFVLSGLVKRRPGDDVYMTFSLLWLTLLIVWPSSRQGLRFIYPLIPIYLYFLFQGAERLLPGRARGLRHVAWAWSILFLIATLIQLDGQASHGPVEGPYQPDSLELFAMIGREVDVHEPVSFFKPRVLTLYTGRWSADVADPSDPRAASIRWFVYRLARPERIPRDYTDWEEVFRNPTFVVFRRR